MSPANAAAESIKSYRQHHAGPPNISSSEVDALQDYLAGGPRHWATTPAPQFPFGLRITNPNGTLRNNEVVSFLTWLRNRHPVVFDKRHPVIAPLFKAQAQMLAHAQAKHLAAATITSAHPQVAEQVLAPLSRLKFTSAPVPAGPNVAAEVLAVPEPSSVITSLVVFEVAGGWWANRKGSKRAGSTAS